MKKEIIIGSIIIAGAILGTTLIITGEEPKEELTKDQQDGIEFVVEMREAFTDGCVGQGATMTECNCVFDGIMDEYGTVGFVDLINEYDYTGEMPFRAQLIINKCY